MQHFSTKQVFYSHYDNIGSVFNHEYIILILNHGLKIKPLVKLSADWTKDKLHWFQMQINSEKI